MDKDTKYLPFPITFLQTAFEDIRQVCSDIMEYATYWKSLDESGTEQARFKERADFSAQVDALRAEMAALQSQYNDTNYRLTALNQQTPAAAGTALVIAVASDSSATPTQPVTTDEARELYNSAYRDLLRGNYQLSLAGFTEYMQKYPSTDLTDNAQYWIGEVYYAQGRFMKAIAEFEKVIKGYPAGDKKASALLKIAYSYINMDENEHEPNSFD